MNTSFKKKETSLVADIEEAVGHAAQIASLQVPGNFLLSFHDCVNGKPVERIFVDNRAPDFRDQVRKHLMRLANEELYPFYGVNAFVNKNAKAANITGSKIAQVDADGVVLPPVGPMPSKMIRTSPNNAQLLYFLDRVVTPDEAQKISAYLTKLVGGDSGGHSPAKLLRLPGTRNLKPKYHPNYPIVSVIEERGIIHSADELLAMTRRANASKSPKSNYEDIEKEAEQIDVETVITRLWSNLSKEAKHRYKQPNVYGPLRFSERGVNVVTFPREDCSETIWRYGNDLKSAGATPPETFAIIRKSAHWKDRMARGKAEDPERLISRLYADVVASSLEAIDPADWADAQVPTREWLLSDWIPMRKVTGLYGDGGVGKTTLAMQLAISVALGVPFLGQEVRQGRVYSFLAEDESDDAHITFDEVIRAYGVEYPARNRMRILPRLGHDNILMAFAAGSKGATRLFESLLADIVQFDPVLVILDTAADLFDGNESERGQVRRFIQEICGRIALDTGAAVLLCAHPSKSGLSSGDGTSGSTAWNNTLRSRLYFNFEIDEKGEELDPDVRTLTLMKSNKSRRGSQFRLRWSDGVFVSDDLVARATPELSATEQRIIDEVRRAFAAGVPWSANPQAGYRYIVNWMISDLHMKRAKAQSALTHLISSGKIVQEEYDRHRHKTGLRTLDQPVELARKSRSQPSDIVVHERARKRRENAKHRA